MEPRPIQDEIANAVGNIAEKASKAGFRALSDEEWEERWKKEAEETRRSKAYDILRESNCPERQLNKTEFEPEPQWTAALDKIKSLAGKGFICALIGKRGTGKTQIAVEAIRHVANDGRRAKYFTAMDFFLSVKSSFRKDAEKTEQEILSTFYAPRLLVLDEMQERGETEWEDRLLTHLIDRRYADMKDTLLLSNLTEEEFKKSVGPSIISRLIETGGIIECNWTNFRTKKVEVR